MNLFKKRTSKEYNDPITDESLESISSRLSEVESEIELLNQQLTEAFALKVQSKQHDGTYNQAADALTIRRQSLLAEQQELLMRLDVIRAGLASIALGTGSPKK